MSAKPAPAPQPTGRVQVAPTRTVPARPRRKSPRGLVIAAAVIGGLGFACLAAMVLFYLLLGLGRPNQTAQIVPAGSPLLVSFKPDPRQAVHYGNAQDLQSLAPVLATVPGLQQMADEAQDLLQAEYDLDLWQDVLPWIGTEASLAMMAAGPNTSPAAPPLVLAVATRSEARSNAFLEKLRAAMTAEGATFAREDYRGTEVVYMLPDSPGTLAPAFATVNGLVVVGANLDALHRAVDASLGEDRATLADQEAYEAVTKALPANRSATVYLDVPALLGQFEGEIELPADIASVRAVGASFALTRDVLRIDTVLSFDPESLAGARPTAGDPSLPRFKTADLLPAGALAYAASQDLASAWRTGVEAVAGQQYLEEALAAIQAETGVDLAGDVLGRLTGEYAVVVLSDQSSSLRALGAAVGVVILAETGEREALRASLETLSAALEAGGAVVSRRAVGAASVTYFQDPSSGWQIGLALEGDRLFVGSSESALTRALEGRQQPLASDPAYRLAVSQIEAHSDARLFVNAEDLTAAIRGALSASDRAAFDRDALPYLEPIKAVAASIGAIDSAGLQRSAVYLYLPGE